MRMTLDLLHEFANTEVFCLFHNATCNPDTLKSMSLSSRCVNKPMDCSLSTGLPVLIWAASTFSSASLSWSKRSTNTGTLLLTSLPVLTLVLLQSNKTRLSISWARETGWLLTLNRSLPVLNNCVFDFGWSCWESSLPPAEPNSFIQFYLEIFGGGRGDAYTFSYMISPSFHHNSFRKDDCVRSSLIECESVLFWASLISTQYTVFRCFFHAVCRYRARRAAFRSMLFGSLCSLFIGSTDVKNTVCLSLPKICPPGINPEFMMECKLIAHPMW